MFDDVELRETQKAGDATEWAKEAALTGFDSVFSIPATRRNGPRKQP